MLLERQMFEGIIACRATVGRCRVGMGQGVRISVDNNR